MGIALVIKSNSNEFRYWFYSDFKSPNEQKCPITGRVEFDGDRIRLLPSPANTFLYDTNWHLVVHKGDICLLGDRRLGDYRDGKDFPDDGLLYKIDGFDEKKPVMNRRLKRE